MGADDIKEIIDDAFSRKMNLRRICMFFKNDLPFKFLDEAILFVTQNKLFESDLTTRQKIQKFCNIAFCILDYPESCMPYWDYYNDPNKTYAAFRKNELKDFTFQTVADKFNVSEETVEKITKIIFMEENGEIDFVFYQ